MRGLNGLVIREASESQKRRNPLQTGHPFVKRIVVWTVADAPINRRVPPNRLAKHMDLPFAWTQLTRHELKESRLAGAIRTEQTGDAR